MGDHEAPAVKPTKAIIAGLGTFGSGVLAGAADGHLTLVEWAVAIGSALVTLATVYRVTNAPLNRPPVQ